MSKIIYVDMDDVLCDFSGAYQKAISDNPWIKYPQSQFDFFRKLKPIENGIDVVNFLESKDIFTIYFLTAPSLKNPLCYTEKRLWIEDKFGFGMVSRLIISPNKGLNKGSYLIDDYQSGKGQENFEGTLIHFGSEEFGNWQKILDYFKNKYNLK